ncbi:MAG: hypothetical protein H6554_01280 [Chitinophagales bacterium]|nr:hypothetical protein [Chitinophagales bacterium]
MQRESYYPYDFSELFQRCPLHFINVKNDTVKDISAYRINSTLTFTNNNSVRMERYIPSDKYVEWNDSVFFNFGTKKWQEYFDYYQDYFLSHINFYFNFCDFSKQQIAKTISLDFEEYTKTHPDGILQSIEIFSPDMIFICYRDWQEKLNRYVLLQLVGDKVEILPVATAFPFLPPEAYEKNDTDTH